MRRLALPRLPFWRSVLVVLLVAGFYGAFVRFFRGLGASTNLSDRLPLGSLGRLRHPLRGRAGRRRLHRQRHRLHLPSRALPPDRPTRDPDRVPRLHAGDRRAPLRPGAAESRVAPPDHVEPALGHVRGRLVRDSVFHRARARVQPDGLRAVPHEARVEGRSLRHAAAGRDGRAPVHPAPELARILLSDRSLQALPALVHALAPGLLLLDRADAGLRDDHRRVLHSAPEPSRRRSRWVSSPTSAR